MEAGGVDGGSVNDDDVGERWMAGSVVGMVVGGSVYNNNKVFVPGH